MRAGNTDRERVVAGIMGLALTVAIGLFVGVSRGVAAEEEEPEPAVEEKKPPGTWHATAFVRGRMGIRVIDYWSKGSNMFASTLIGGHPITTIVRGDRYIVFDALTGRGLDIRRSKIALADDAKRIRPFAFELDELILDGGEKIEDTKIGSMDGEIWRVTDDNGRRKLWVTTGTPRVPIRVETFSRGSAETIALDYSGWVFDLDLNDAFFTAPSRIELTRFEYDAYVAKSIDQQYRAIPILYPDLLHGNPPR